MSLPARINSLLEKLPGTSLLPVQRNLPQLTGPEIRMIGNEISIYPEDGGERYVDKGYRRNDGVYSIVSRNAEKCSQVRLYHMAIKRGEQKTAQEYTALTKGAWNDKVIKEMGKMRKAMTEDLVIDSPLQKLLNKPNRNQVQSEWIEDIVGLRELQGEGNIWLNIPKDKKVPTEMLNVPKPQLVIVGDSRDPWNVVAYEFILSGNTYRWDPDRVVMWKYASKTGVDAMTMAHLRGMAPLEAGIMLVQAMNEADLRIATSNKNGGAAGLAYKKVAGSIEPSPEQKTEMRSQFNNAVNSNEMANKIAVLSGEWGYHNFATSVKEQMLLEQYGVGFKRLCRIFKTPAQIFDEGNSTWDNQRQAEKRWIYSKVAPIMASLRDRLQDALVLKFGLDPERHLIDFDLSGLPELADDLKEKVTALKDADWLSDNEKRAECGYEKKVSKILDLTQREYDNHGISGSLDDDLNALENE